MKWFRLIFLISFSLTVTASFGQKRILDRVEKAIFQLDYQIAKNELVLYLEKNDQQENNCFKLLSARIYGDPESPYFNPDSAYELMTHIQYYPATFDPKIDVVICKNYNACIDTVAARKEQYAKSILHIAMEKNWVSALKDFIEDYSIHKDLIRLATDKLYEMEFEITKKKNALLTYSKFIEEYPEAPQVPEARELMLKLKYERVVRRNNVKEYKLFLEEYPGSIYEDKVYQHIEQVRWDYCLKGEDVNRYREYLENYPDSKHKQEAKDNILKIQWDQVQQVDEVPYYRWFAREYPDNKNTPFCKTRIQELRWQQTLQDNTIESYKSFIAEFPDTLQSKTALTIVERLILEEAEEMEFEVTD